LENNSEVKVVVDDAKKPTDQKRYYRARDLADYLSCGVSTVWWLAKNKDGFPQPKSISPNLTVWDIKEVDNYLANI